MQSLCRCLAVIVSFGVVLAAVPSPAADSADAESINKLIEKLSSGRFAEREKAQKALEGIGLPALDALKKAAESTDPETKRRAGELVEKFERQVTGAKILAPTKIHLQFKDTPVPEAVEQIKKKMGFNILLQDPQGKLGERKITLDTGEVSFWEAFDQFCAKAGLVESDSNEGQPVPGGQPGFIQPGVIQPLPGRIQIQPLPANQPGGIRIQQLPARQIQIEQILPVVPEKKQDAAPAKPAPKTGLSADDQPAKEQPAETKPAPALKPVRAQIAKPVQVQVQPVPGVRAIRRPRPWQQPGIAPEVGPIVLKEGKVESVPTAYSGAVRIQVIDGVKMFGAGANGELTVGLKVSPEPKIRWQQLITVRIDKAIDDQDQKLLPAMSADATNPGGIGHALVGYGGPHQYIPIRLAKGEKASKELKELVGSLTAQVLAAPETFITVDEVAKSAGKTIKGKESSSIKVSNFVEQNGQIILSCELNAPAGVVGAGNTPANGGVIGFQVAPAVLPALPPQAPPRKALPPQKDVPKLPGALQVEDKPVPVPLPVQRAQVQIQVQQIQIGGNGGVVQIGGFGGAGFGGAAGLELLDADGKVIPCVGSNMIGRANAGGPVTFEHQLIFQPQKDQKATKLVFRGSKSVNVDVPFSLKNVKVN